VDLQGEIASDHWEALRDLLPAYRSISYIKLGDGKSSSFWVDHWLPLDSTLAATFPTLHSHFKGGDMSVHEVMNRGFLVNSGLESGGELKTSG